MSNKKINTDNQDYVLSLIHVKCSIMQFNLEKSFDLFKYPLIEGQHLELITKLQECVNLTRTIQNNFVKLNSNKED